MRIQNYGSAHKRIVPATKFTCSNPLRVIKSIEGAAFMQPCALTLTKPQTKTNVWPKVRNLEFSRPLWPKQSSHASLLWQNREYKQNSAEGRNSGQAAPCPRLIRFQEREDACTWILSVSCLLLFCWGSGRAREICKLFPTDHFPDRLEQNNSG